MTLPCNWALNPKGQCTQIVYTLAPKYLSRATLRPKYTYLGTWTLRDMQLELVGGWGGGKSLEGAGPSWQLSFN